MNKSDLGELQKEALFKSMEHMEATTYKHAVKLQDKALKGLKKVMKAKGVHLKVTYVVSEVILGGEHLCLFFACINNSNVLVRVTNLETSEIHIPLMSWMVTEVAEDVLLVMPSMSLNGHPLAPEDEDYINTNMLALPKSVGAVSLQKATA